MNAALAEARQDEGHQDEGGRDGGRPPPVRLDPTDRERPGLGHNGGPPLSLTWEAWLWRRAHAAAWKTPPRDVALRRLRRAARLGLDYKDYTAVLLDRGVHLSAVVFALDAVPGPTRRALRERLATIAGQCRVLVCLPAPFDPDVTGGATADLMAMPADAPPERLALAVERFMRGCNLPPSAAFMVGTQGSHLRAAEESGLGLFKWARDYLIG